MKWSRAILCEKNQTGTDETHNPIFEVVETEKHIQVRTALWIPTHDSAEGNQFDEERRTFLTKARRNLLDDVFALKVRGVLYEIESIMEDSSPIVIRVKRSKDGIPNC